MGVRKVVTQEAITRAAVEIVQTSGEPALSMRTLAARLGVQAPTLYDHVRNRDHVIALVQAHGLADFGRGFAAAGATTRDKVRFYREWALGNRNLYPVVFQIVLQRALLPSGLEAQVLQQVVAAAGGSHVVARAIWAQLHGLVDLELQGRLPADAEIDATWEAVIRAITTLRET